MTKKNAIRLYNHFRNVKNTLAAEDMLKKNPWLGKEKKKEKPKEEKKEDPKEKKDNSKK